MASPSNVSNLRPAVAPNQGIYEESTTQEAQIGTRISVGDREFIYAQAGADIAAGEIVATPVSTLSVAQTAGAAGAVGDTAVTAYIANSAAANAFAEGYLISQDATGQGHAYRVRSHAAIGDTSTGTVYLYDGLASAITTASKLTLVPSAYEGVTDVINGTTPLVGVAPIAVTNGNYFWAQAAGVGAVEVTTTVAYGADLIPGTTGGATLLAASANAPVVGIALAAGTTGDTVPAILAIQGNL